MNYLHCENLILSEEKGKIEVPAQYASKLVTIQRFGIRFLFKQFITKQPGVLLNDPSGYGKRVQVILFLDAIKSLLTEPILIVCQSVERWQQELQAGMRNMDEVAINATSFTNKYKMYYITTFDNIKSHISLKWSVIVIDYSQDDLINNYSKIVKGLKGLKGQFVVWISSHDIKISKHLHVVSTIFEWMDKDFQNKFKEILSGIWKCKCNITRTIQLDRAFQELYLRRDGLENKFLNEEIEQKEEIPKKNQITKKNKDSTGTKIKRSKRKVNDEANSSLDLQKKKEEEIQQSNITITTENNSTMSDEESSQYDKVCIMRKRSKRLISTDDDDDYNEVLRNKHKNDEKHVKNDINNEKLLNYNNDMIMDSQNAILCKFHRFNELSGENNVLVDSKKELASNSNENIQETISENGYCSHKDRIIKKPNNFDFSTILTESDEIKVSDDVEIAKNNYAISTDTKQIECERIINKKNILEDKVVNQEDKLIEDKVKVIDELDELEKTVYKKYKGSLLDLL